MLFMCVSCVGVIDSSSSSSYIIEDETSDDYSVSFKAMIFGTKKRKRSHK